MSPVRNTARKTTGKHTHLTAALSQSQPPASPASGKKRTRQSCQTPVTPSARKAKTPRVVQAATIVAWDSQGFFIPSSPPDSPPSTTQVSSSAPETSRGAPSPSADVTTLTSGALIKRRLPNTVLDKPISVCTRFATWLENQKHVHDDVLARAVERDGTRFLCLAKAALSFDNAVRGHVPLPLGPVLDNPLCEHARTLRVFAEFLRSKVAEDALNEELQAAVLRDGEALLRLALCCLDFDQAIRGSGSSS